MDEGFFRPAIGIIGASGRMGRWFGDSFEQLGYEVRRYSRSQGPLSADWVQASPVVILSVPVGSTLEVMRTIGPWLKPDQLLMDLGSLKAGPLKAMRENADCPVIGTHPLFGPSVNSLEGQLIFLCSDGGGRWSQWLKRLWQDQGARLVEIEPERHDRLMGQIQTLRHFMLYAMGRTLLETGFDRQTDAELSGPYFGELLGMLEHQIQQPADLYTELALHNPYGREVMDCFTRQTQILTQKLDRGDKSALIEAVSRVEAYFGPSA